MKFFVLASIILFLGCSSQKNTVSLKKLKNEKSYTITNCPTDGTCILKVIPNKSLALKKDAFGQLYGETINSNNIMLKYSYKRNTPTNLADAHYSETYYLSITKSTTELYLTDEDLQQVGLVVERQCYCKDTAGFFKITKGNLKLNIEKNELTLSGNFSNKKLPLLITRIDEKVSLAQ